LSPRQHTIDSKYLDIGSLYYCQWHITNCPWSLGHCLYHQARPILLQPYPIHMFRFSTQHKCTKDSCNSIIGGTENHCNSIISTTYLCPIGDTLLIDILYVRAT